MTDSPDAQPASPTVQVVTANQTPPPDPTAILQALIDQDKTRQMVVKFVFWQFIGSVVGIGAAMVFKGWEISNTTNSILVMILQAELAAMGTCVGYYLGSSQGSAMKSMQAALSQKQQ